MTAGAAFVTGASGFLGRHLVRALLGRGRPVFALCRPGAAPLPAAEGRTARVVEGDLERPESYRDAIGGGTTVFHLAAVRNRPGHAVAALQRINVTATAWLARTAAAAGASRLVNVSTALVYGPSRGAPVAERAELAVPARDTAFLASRRRGLTEVRRAAAETGLDVVTVCPTIVFGPDHPSHPNRVAQHMRSLIRRGISVVLGGGSQRRTLAYVDDVIRGILLAEREARAGDEFVLGGTDVAPREFDRLVMSCAGRWPRARVSLPVAAARAAAALADALRRHERGAGYAAAVSMLSREWCYSSRAAEERLGYRRTPLEQAIELTLQAGAA